VSIRPDTIVVVERQVRDQWVLATAQSTLERLHQVNLALQGGCSDDRILTAVRHYSVTKTRLRDLAMMVEGAVKTVRPPGTESLPKPDARAMVLDFITTERGSQGSAIEDIIAVAATRGIPQEAVLTAIESLITDDECYQPRKGFIKLL
jgi:hypothetical protein